MWSRVNWGIIRKSSPTNYSFASWRPPRRRDPVLHLVSPSCMAAGQHSGAPDVYTRVGMSRCSIDGTTALTTTSVEEKMKQIAKKWFIELSYTESWFTKPGHHVVSSILPNHERIGGGSWVSSHIHVTWRMSSFQPHCEKPWPPRLSVSDWMEFTCKWNQWINWNPIVKI